MQNLRLERVRELLKREIGEIIRRRLNIEETGVVTVNDVTVANNLKGATVYVGVVGTAEQKQNALKTLLKSRKDIQSALASSVVLKYTPHLRFSMDESIHRGDRVLKILEEIEKDIPPQ